MRKKIEVSKKDANRVLLTDTLPYEVPVNFSNERLYRYYKNAPFAPGKAAPVLIRRLLETQEKDFTLPFDYSIRQGATKRRTLSIVHPRIQKAFSEMYAEYDEYILSLCSKSTISLRYPSRVAEYFYEKKIAPRDNSFIDQNVEIEPDLFHPESRYASSYFSYRHYSQLYKFVDSREFHELESRFPVLVQIDVKRCFPSIYTHSVAWAVKGKAHAKKNIGAHSFETIIDGLMQASNYKETTGIVVGPEFSRVFAEIIFQEIDRQLTIRLRDLDAEGEVRRYIDDYFVFARTKEVADKIIEIIQECLRAYKLYVNDAKTQAYERPFATPQTVAKRDVYEVLSKTIVQWLSALGSEHAVESGRASLPPARYHAKQPSNIIRDVKVVVRRSGATFDVVCGYALGVITKAMMTLGRRTKRLKESPDLSGHLGNALKVTMEVAFFLYSMDARVRTTYRISQIVLIASRICRQSGLDASAVDDVATRLTQKAVLDLTSQNICGMETINLLVALKSIQTGQKMDQKVLLNLHSGNYKNPMGRSRRNYFEIMCLLYYIGADPTYSELSGEIRLDIEEVLNNAEGGVKNTEATLLLLDVASCPYLDKPYKQKVFLLAWKKLIGGMPNIAEINETINYAAKNISFIDWDAGPNLERLLQKKELTLAY